jgi:DNA invertase Pin-like site-specific DNA recombinase
MEGGKMANQKSTAIVYVCTIPVAGTDMVISKEDQLARIKKYAEKENIEIAAVIEDDNFSKDFANRPGIQKVLNYDGRYDILLVERIWALGRRMRELVPFMEGLEKRGIELRASSCLWDCVSQQVRHRYMGALAQKQKDAAKSQAESKRGKAAAA